MAEASTSTMSNAQVLREAARRTMRRKQAPDLPSNRIHSSPLPSRSAALPPILSSLVTQPSGLDYGDPMDISPTAIIPNQRPSVSTSSPVAPMPSRPIRRTSLTAAKNAQAADDTSREEGEISEEENRTKQKSSKGVRTSPTETQTGQDSDTLASKSSPLKPSTNRPRQPSRQNSTSGGMPPPPTPSVAVHREPAPISPSATIPTVPPVRSSTVPFSNGTLMTARRNSTPTPTPQTHSFDKPRMDAYRPQTDEDEESLSPATEKLNREFFTKLLQEGVEGVDDKHCRPGLPMTFDQFESAKKLILDLLGYGFSPENIAEIGLNRRLVVYCLRELKIRLPGNINVDDIVPYDPPDETASSDTPSLPPHEEDTAVSIPDSSDATSTVVNSTALQTEEEGQTPSPPQTPTAIDPAPLTLNSTAAPSETSPIRAQPSLPHLNINAAPFHPSSFPREPTGPSLVKMLLPSQQLLPAKRDSPMDIEPGITFSILPRPSFLPPKPSFSVDATSSRKSTAGSSSADPVLITAPILPPSPPSAPSSTSPSPPPVNQMEEIQSEADRVEEQKRMERLEQEKKMVLLRKKLDLKKKQRHTESRAATLGSEVMSKDEPLPESILQPTILGGERVGSPPPMDVDADPYTLSLPLPPTPFTSSNEPVQRMSPKPAETERRYTPFEPQKLQPTTRSPHPAETSAAVGENGPKRGIKRPKADDFVEDVPMKRVTKARTIIAPAPIKRSSFAIFNSIPPEQHVIHWIDDDSLPDIERPPTTGGIFLDPMESTVDSEALKFAAEAIAIGLPMDPSDLEVARLIEERKRKVNEMSIKLLKTQLSLKRLELKKAEKKLRTLQNTNASISLEELAAVNRQIQTLADDLTSIKTQLKEYGVEEASNAMAVVASRSSDNGTPTQLTPSASYFGTPKEESPPHPSIQGQGMEIDAKDTGDGLLSLSTVNGTEIGNLTAKTSGIDHELEAAFDTTGQTRMGWVLQNQSDHIQDEEDEQLQLNAASQSRFRLYEPPLMFSAISSTRSLIHPFDRTQVPTNVLEATKQVEPTKPLKADPNRELCQYEQVGGTCRDSECTGLHFADL